MLFFWITAVGVRVMKLLCFGFLAVAAEQQCGGGAPMKDLLYGCDSAYATADHICCHNHDYAEHFGFLDDPGISLFSKLDPTGRTVFYDSVCAKPLFVAPVPRLTWPVPHLARVLPRKPRVLPCLA